MFSFTWHILWKYVWVHLTISLKLCFIKMCWALPDTLYENMFSLTWPHDRWVGENRGGHAPCCLQHLPSPPCLTNTYTIVYVRYKYDHVCKIQIPPWLLNTNINLYVRYKYKYDPVYKYYPRWKIHIWKETSQNSQPTFPFFCFCKVTHWTI